MVTYEGVIVNAIRSRAFLFGEFNMAESKFKRKESVPLCGCGCRKNVKKSKEYKGWNKYIHGHHAKINNPMQGKTHSLETRKKISNARYNSPSILEKAKQQCLIMAQNNTGKRRTEETKRKISETRLVKKIRHTEETKQKLSKLKMGKPNIGFYSEETRRWFSERMLSGGALHALSFKQRISKPQKQLFKKVQKIYPQAELEYRSQNKFIDIAVPDLMIAIEYDGSYWHNIRKEYDKKRQKMLEKVGWRFLRYIDCVPKMDELKKDLQKI